MPALFSKDEKRRMLQTKEVPVTSETAAVAAQLMGRDE